MKKYHQLLLFVTTVISLSLLLVYRHQYNRLHYVLEVFNFFGHPCNISNLEHTDSIGGYQDWGVEPIWQQSENIYIYSAFWSKNEARAIVLHSEQSEPIRNCYLWYEDKEKPLIGKFKYTKIHTDKVILPIAYFYYCTLTQDHQPYAVSFSTKAKKDNKKILLTIQSDHHNKKNTTICVAPTKFDKSYLVEFLSFHKLVGVNDFIFYQNDIPHRLAKILSNLSARLNIKVRFFPWNYPKTEGSLSRLVVESDCILRTTGISNTSITLQMNEFIVPSGPLISFTESFNKGDGSVPERISLPVQTFCVENTQRRKPIVLQNTDVSYNNDNDVQYVYRPRRQESTVVTHALAKDVISIHKYTKCLEKPARAYRDNSILRFSMDLTRSTLVQLFLSGHL
ncbi:hypothetical protein RN001_000317 [Aquatica leii]|uniref:Glycosyltransferase family 92 protein n=1 Tax=Aquatica leii TaxID=1421715 RepID=A0AAN7PM46_9COLE|nr:hypothetical protein RN001_000317 [Aquatica leii]